MKWFRLFAVCLFASTTGCAAEPVGRYDAALRTLIISLNGEKRFRYVFNKGGAINTINDLQIAPEANLIGESFQGETTDRVIQWTYWNSRYVAKAHELGDKDMRANTTMEGCFHEAATCDVISTPKSGKVSELTFRSRIRHWFYAILDRHGQPDFETTSKYEILPDGSLKLTRRVLHRPWRLKNVSVKTWDGKRWQTEFKEEAVMEAKYFKQNRTSSYFEGWTPFRRTVLPQQKHGNGPFVQDGYKFWKPQELGGWAMAHSDKLAVAVVFGKKEFGNPKYQTRVVFNKLDLENHRLNVLLPAVETDWPDHATLTQTLIFVVGAPDDAARRAEQWVDHIPVPEIIERTGKAK